MIKINPQIILILIIISTIFHYKYTEDRQIQIMFVYKVKGDEWRYRKQTFSCVIQ